MALYCDYCTHAKSCHGPNGCTKCGPDDICIEFTKVPKEKHREEEDAD